MELSQNFNKFNTSDIYSKMNNALEGTEYLEVDDNNKKIIIDKCLFNYLSSKVLELKPNVNMDNLNSLDLMSILNDSLNIDIRDEYLCHIIHYLLSVISTFQGFEVYWEIDDNVDPDNPVLNFNNSILDKIETNSKVNYYKTFGILYEIFISGINKSISEDKSIIKLSLKKENKE